MSMHLWNTSYKQDVESKFTTLLESQKYLLGFFDEYKKLAQDLSNSKAQFC